MANDTSPAVPADRTEAIYGSLLAASVIAVERPPSTATLLVTLPTTAAVFWAVHVHCRVIGGRYGPNALSFRRVLVEESPILYASLPPVLAAVLGWALGVRETVTAWLCLSIAVAEMVGWSVEGAIATGAPRRFVVRSALASMLFGLIMIVLKAALGH